MWRNIKKSLVCKSTFQQIPRSQCDLFFSEEPLQCPMLLTLEVYTKKTIKVPLKCDRNNIIVYSRASALFKGLLMANSAPRTAVLTASADTLQKLKFVDVTEM